MKIGLKKRAKVYSVFTKDHLIGPLYEIGDFTYGQPIVIHFGENTKLIIGKFCSIAQNVKIFIGGNHRVDWISTFPFKFFEAVFPNAFDIEGHPSSKGNVVIGNDVWIGHSATILSGISIGNGAVIATHAVITKNIGAYEIWAGNPAKMVRKRFTDEQIKQLEKINWWNWKIERINEEVKNLSSEQIDEFIKNNV